MPLKEWPLGEYNNIAKLETVIPSQNASLNQCEDIIIWDGLGVTDSILPKMTQLEPPWMTANMQISDRYLKSVEFSPVSGQRNQDVSLDVFAHVEVFDKNKLINQVIIQTLPHPPKC